ncbi:hypothetical protein BDZ91DRAFT_745602 [Kalaharituber pfeilii]|nr:hypothetical protein BDZ91DRAFT_745602 [Kalaharituber pfeilii]
MDLTSLSSTLPSQGQQQPANYDFPPADLMSAFKQAAFSVTTLWKTANGEIERAKKEGYQECLEELLHLIGSDRIYANSEVIKIREWASARQRRIGGDSESGVRHSDSPTGEESEDEQSRSHPAETSTAMNSDPPVASLPSQQHRTLSISLSSPSCESSPVPSSPLQTYRSLPKDNPSTFSFRAAQRLPQHVPPQPRLPIREDIDLLSQAPVSPAATPPSTEQTSHLFNHNVFTPSSHRTSSGALKRRFPMVDFLELAAMAEKEKAAYAGMEFGGGKRGRMT